MGCGSQNLKQIEIALKDTIYTVSVERDGKIIGMGRIIGDGARVFYIQDVEYSWIIKEWELAQKFEKFGFYKRPNDFQGSGMMLNINK